MSQTNYNNVLSWHTQEWIVAQFMAKLNPTDEDHIDVDPIGQRPDIESLDKKQGIIDTMLRGFDFGEIKLRKLTNDKEFGMRSVDGGHRKRAVRDFINNKFKTGKDTVATVDGVEYDVSNKFYKELPSEVKNIFNNYKMRFTIYSDNMTDEQAGEIFRRTNITTDVNHQEMLNSYEDNLVSDYIRTTARSIRGQKNEFHKLFEFKSTDPEDRKQYWWQQPSKRLRDDEFVTRILTMMIKISDKKINFLTASNTETEDVFRKYGNPINGVWVKNPKLAEKHKKMVNETLDFLFDYVEAKKNNSKQLFSTQEFTLVSRLYAYLINVYGKSFKVDDWNLFYNSVRNAMDKFLSKDDSFVRTDTHKDDKGVRTVCECFRQYLTVHNNEKKCNQSIMWLLEELNIDDCGLTFLDPVRVFSQEIIEQVWRQQGHVCWVTGTPLDISDAVGGHIIPHSDGGKTDIDNCMVCHKDENTKMGSQDANMYRAARLAELAA